MNKMNKKLSEVLNELEELLEQIENKANESSEELKETESDDMKDVLICIKYGKEVSILQGFFTEQLDKLSGGDKEVFEALFRMALMSFKKFYEYHFEK